MGIASDLLKNFSIDTWYKAVLYLGGAIFAFSLFFDVKGMTNTELQLLSGGAFMFGLGEWKNRKDAIRIKPPNLYTGGTAVIKETIRIPNFVGVLFDVIGVGLLVMGIFRIVRS